MTRHRSGRISHERPKRPSLNAIPCFGVDGAEPAGAPQKANLPQTAPKHTEKKARKMDFPTGTLRYESNSYQCNDRYMWLNVFLPDKVSMETAPTCIKRDKNVALTASICCPGIHMRGYKGVKREGRGARAGRMPRTHHECDPQDACGWEGCCYTTPCPPRGDHFTPRHSIPRT